MLSSVGPGHILLTLTSHMLVPTISKCMQVTGPVKASIVADCKYHEHLSQRKKLREILALISVMFRRFESPSIFNNRSIMFPQYKGELNELFYLDIFLTYQIIFNVVTRALKKPFAPVLSLTFFPYFLVSNH